MCHSNIGGRNNVLFIIFAVLTIPSSIGQCFIAILHNKRLISILFVCLFIQIFAKFYIFKFLCANLLRNNACGLRQEIIVPLCIVKSLQSRYKNLSLLLRTDCCRVHCLGWKPVSICISAFSRIKPLMVVLYYLYSTFLYVRFIK